MQNTFLFIQGATVDESEMIDGMVLSQKVSARAGGVNRIEKAKIGLIQFCTSFFVFRNYFCHCKLHVRRFEYNFWKQIRIELLIKSTEFSVLSHSIF